MKVLIVCGSPRRDGNSNLLAAAALQGVDEAGHAGELVHLDDHLRGFLRDCRRCRDQAGNCTIDDGFDALFLGKVLPANAIVFATPLYWYGMSGQLKTFLDRIFCYISPSFPGAGAVISDLQGKRLAVILSSEESYVGASLGVLHQMQEYARYTHSSLVAVINGIGNKRGDVAVDPADPIGRARDVGRRLFELRSTDYRLDTERAGSVWGAPDR